MKQKVIYFHGLESGQGGPKVDFLAKKYEVIAPEMNYHDPKEFEKTLHMVKCLQAGQRHKPELIIGSSMGGYFAYMIATHTNIPVVLLNPALHSREFEPQGVSQGPHEVEGTLILGAKDDVIDPVKTTEMLKESIKNGQLKSYLRDHGHRTPLKIFEDYL
jgi:hypothetical protein